MSKVLDMLDRLEAQTKARVGAATPELRLRAIYRRHGQALVEALVKRHDEFWGREPHSCEDDGGPYLEECKALAAMQRDLDEALRQAQGEALKEADRA